MQPTDYNPEGKKLTYLQHLQLMKKQEEKKKAALLLNDGEEKPWLCENCSQSRYRLKADRGRLIRICKECATERIF